MNLGDGCRGAAWVGLLCVSVTVSVPSPSSAAGLSLGNETNQAVIVQSAFVARTVVRRGRPALLPPGGVYKEVLAQPGNLILTIYDANQPSRVLFQDSILSLGADLLFTIKTVAPIPVLRAATAVPEAPRVQLHAVAPPPPRPARERLDPLHGASPAVTASASKR